MFAHQLGLEIWIPGVALAANALGRVVKGAWPGLPAWALLLAVAAFAYAVMLGDQLLGGAAIAPAAKAALWGLVSAAGAIGLHEAAKKLLTAWVGEGAAEWLLGKLRTKAAGASNE